MHTKFIFFMGNIKIGAVFLRYGKNQLVAMAAILDATFSSTSILGTVYLGVKWGSK